MDQQPTDQTLVGISFGDPFRAQEFLTAATRLASEKKLQLRDAVFIGKDTNGRVLVRETMDPTPGRTALSGAVWAGLFGLILGGPVGWLIGAGVGAGAGAVTAKVMDHGVPDEWVGWFKQAVQPGSTVLALLVSDLNRAALLDELERFHGATLVYANLPEASLEQIRRALDEPPQTPTDAGPAEGGASAAGESGLPG
jgi:uncharacterized membrane protein